MPLADARKAALSDRLCRFVVIRAEPEIPEAPRGPTP
jgi:hypothetical protein